MKPIYLFFLLALLSLTGFSQPLSRCGTTQILQSRIQNDPGMAQRMQDADNLAKDWLNQNPQARTSGSILQIPVVVHVLYRLPVHNISDAQIFSQINVLNQDYRRQNPDAGNLRQEFDSLAADTQIQFCLASFDTAGNPTTGIIRTSTTTTNIGMTTQYYVEAPVWDHTKYLNIWVCEIGGGILGFAYPPGAASASYDGAVIDYRYFGNMGTVTDPYDLGRTTTHEIGHYLGLKHIWGDASDCVTDDGIDDTPLCTIEHYDCDLTANTCVDVPYDFHDMVENYMDYSDDDCMNTFTYGQKDKCRSTLNTSRVSLLTSPGCPPVSNYERHDQNFSIQCLPNNGDGNFVFRVNGLDHPHGSLKIFDALGRTISVQTISQKETQIDISGKAIQVCFVLFECAQFSEVESYLFTR